MSKHICEESYEATCIHIWTVLASLKVGCTGSSESTLVKMPHSWKSHVAAQLYLSPSVALAAVRSNAVIVLVVLLYCVCVCGGGGGGWGCFHVCIFVRLCSNVSSFRCNVLIYDL